MNWDIPSAYPPKILIATLAAALLFHLSRLAGPRRLLHAAYAATAAGLIYILGSAAFGWRSGADTALLWVYGALFALVGVYAARRRAQLGAIGLPWLSALIQQGVMAYMFAPDWFRKPPVTFLLLVYFALEVVVWLRGREEETDPLVIEDADSRPPLFPPKRRRGLTEAALAAVSVAIVYLLFVGPRPTEQPAAQTASEEEEVEQTAAIEEAASAQEPAAEGQEAAEIKPAETRQAETGVEAPQQAEEATPESQPPTAAPQIAAKAPDAAASGDPAKDDGVYAARAGDTFKSIARRVYGTSAKWRAIADVNPGVKSKKFRAGQVIRLPPSPAR